MKHKMRKSKREVTDKKEITDIINRGEFCVIAINDEEGYPYLVPLNYGMQEDAEGIKLYFHSGKLGRKHELLMKNNRVGFNIVNDARVGKKLDDESNDCYYETSFESVVGEGDIYYAEGEEKLKGLYLLLEHHNVEKRKNGEYKFSEKMLNATEVFVLTVKELKVKKK